MPKIKGREGEPVDALNRRFKRACEKAGVITDCRKREFYEKPTAKRKREFQAAVKRRLKKQSRDRVQRDRRSY